MIRFAGAAAFLALAQASAAQASTCFTVQEVKTLVALSAPSLVDAAAKKCASFLPEGAFLRTGAQAMAERLRSEAKAHQNVTPVIEKLAGEKMPAGLSEATIRSMVDEMLGMELMKDIKPDDCASVNDLASSLAQLSGATLADMVSAILVLSQSEKEPDSSFPICES
jgi:hypothetical protein